MPNIELLIKKLWA